MVSASAIHQLMMIGKIPNLQVDTSTNHQQRPSSSESSVTDLHGQLSIPESSTSTDFIYRDMEAGSSMNTDRLTSQSGPEKLRAPSVGGSARTRW